MAHQLSIRLDADTYKGVPPSYASGNLLRGEVRFVPETDIYLNSITVTLVWSVRPQAMSTSVGDEHELDLVTRGVFGLGDEFAKPSQKDLLEFRFDGWDREVVDQRKISRESVPGFANVLAAGSDNSWRFTFPLPNEPWSYMGRLFRIRWYVEGKADIGRGPARIIPFRHLPETFTEFTLASTDVVVRNLTE